VSVDWQAQGRAAPAWRSQESHQDLTVESPDVRPPVQFIVGAKDQTILEINRGAAKRLTTEHYLVVVAGASHLFEELGKLDTVARHAQQWFSRYMKTPATLASENRFD
jgi:putative phosphoribosyl transferase